MKLRFSFLCICVLSSLSCHKNKNNNKKSCTGDYIYIDIYTGGGASGVTYSLSEKDANTGIQTGTYGSIFIFGYNYGKGAYDIATKYYYLYASYSSHGIKFYRLPLSSGYKYDGSYSSTICDTLTNWQQNELLCNSAGGKLYFVSHGPHVDRIYRIDTSGLFSETQIYAADSVGAISAPVVDEHTGYIYFFSSPYLMKVDPISGVASVVATCSNVKPAEIQYNNNDGMFYGINIYAQPYTFIRINPENGVVTTLADASYYTVGMGHSFDVCNNVYIVKNYWLDPTNGKVVNTMSWNTSGNIYINGLQ